MKSASPSASGSAPALPAASNVSEKRRSRTSWSHRAAATLVPWAARWFAGASGAKRLLSTIPASPRVLIVRRNRMGDMLCAYPLIRAIRMAYPGALIHIACDKAALAVAQACPHADGAILLRSGLHRWHTALRNASRLQGYDVAIAVKGGFDIVLASIVRLSNAPVRIGFAPSSSPAALAESTSSAGEVRATASAGAPTSFYTHALPPPPWGEHQMETCLRLAEPLLSQHPANTSFNSSNSAGSRLHALPQGGAPCRLDLSDDLLHSVPRITTDISQWAAEAVGTLIPQSAGGWKFGIKSRAPLALVNISSTAPLKWQDTHFQQLAAQLNRELGLAVALVFAPADEARARAIAGSAGAVSSRGITALATPTPLHLAAVMQHAAFVFSPEGGAGHLAAFTGTPLILLWSEGPFDKWHARAARCRVFRADLAHPAVIAVDEVVASVVQEGFYARAAEEGE